jgi:MSHA biogenesis protein MshJ
MNITVEKIAEKYNARSLRERIFIAIAVLALIYLFWYNVLYSYLLASDEEVSKNLQAIKSQISQLEGQIDTISTIVGRNPTSTLLAQSKNLKTENDVLNKKISAYIQKMVKPSEMDEMLENIIQKASGLKVLSIENLPAKAIFEPKDGEANAKHSGLKVFNHTVQFQFTGNYFDTLRFLKALEQEKLNVIWDSFAYEVIAYPKAKITIELSTLSLEEGWIGV